MVSILHLVNQSPFANNALQQCVSRINNEQDALVLLENGVYGALSKATNNVAIPSIKRCYAIEEDILARGISREALFENITLIDYTTFVKLTVEFPLSQSWY
ncbi:sulfurtransferase complex subunit TusB [Eionea flava]